MAIRKYEFKITGLTPLLMHHDNIDWADQMTTWKNDPANKKKSVAGDDRSPAFRWIGNLYHDGEHVAMSATNLSKAIMEGASMVPVGKGAKTFKAQSQSGMAIDQPFLKVAVSDGRLVPMEAIRPLMAEADFAEHKIAAQALGFSLFVKRAKVGTSKHVRVRPMFDQWSISGSVSVWDDAITQRALADFFSYAGEFKGLGDWRPSSATPGSYGRFVAEVKKT